MDNFKENVPGCPPYIRVGHGKNSALNLEDAEEKAWMKGIVQEGDVLYALAEAINQQVEQGILSKKYRFASAEYDNNYVYKETGKNMGTVLLGIGLTNELFLTRLPKNVVLVNPQDIVYMDYQEYKAEKKRWKS